MGARGMALGRPQGALCKAIGHSLGAPGMTMGARGMALGHSLGARAMAMGF